ncbi:sigma-70 family RNA polymerase sigma factor [Streptomyces sp. NBC_01481]|uniref:sigma-70 family RNA polymerase sigma factor n=1 Tax=Streptomyces sp. NBC_01481 TaxID=2975869 RepID=UPI00224E6B14|nr:sigma-70 family RNA polymerase sigma factor [Streptomyces sp. NBC_01481]MCX4583183.1 sigma-70 family RNA polymerase sigma factor [Streptomyces sp. NBC_01481]
MAAWRKARVAGEDPEEPLDAALVDRVRAVLALGGVPHAELQDGVQQVWLRLLEARAKGREAPRSLAAWCAVVASNIAMDWHRAQRRRERLDERLTALRPWERAHQGGEEARVLALAVAEGLEELPLEQRQVLVLRFYADLPVAKIAAALEIPEGTVKSRLHAGVGAMRKRLHADEAV